jgi:hypothetical protein
MKSRLLLGLGVLVPFSLGGCDLIREMTPRTGRVAGSPATPESNLPVVCTLIGCSDGLIVTIRPRLGTFPTGAHEVLIAPVGGPARTCRFTFPFPPGETAIASGNCGGGVYLTVARDYDCPDGAISLESCTWEPGKFEELINVPGSPLTRVRITQKIAGGATYLDREVDVRYEDYYPNGMRCEPVCKRAKVEWEFDGVPL